MNNTIVLKFTLKSRFLYIESNKANQSSISLYYVTYRCIFAPNPQSDLDSHPFATNAGENQNVDENLNHDKDLNYDESLNPRREPEP
jgi:hypothetical protein